MVDAAGQSQRLVYEDKQMSCAWPSRVQRGHFGADSLLSHLVALRGHGVKHFARRAGDECALREILQAPVGSGDEPRLRKTRSGTC
jgi:hypothetical protein